MDLGHQITEEGKKPFLAQEAALNLGAAQHAA